MPQEEDKFGIKYAKEVLGLTDEEIKGVQEIPALGDIAKGMKKHKFDDEGNDKAVLDAFRSI